jgi:hypothetical protein
MTAEAVSTRASTAVSWTLDVRIKPGSAPDRPMPYSSVKATYRPARLRLVFRVSESCTGLRTLRPGSELMADAMQDVKLDGIVLYGPRLRKDGAPGERIVTENLYGRLDQAPDWAQAITAAALHDLKEER